MHRPEQGRHPVGLRLIRVGVAIEERADGGAIALLDRVGASFDHPLQIEGILLTMFDDRTNLAKLVAADLREFFGTQVLKTVIPRNIRLAEAPSHGKPIIMYDPGSRGSESYIQLAKEILANEQKRPAKSSR